MAIDPEPAPEPSAPSPRTRSRWSLLVLVLVVLGLVAAAVVVLMTRDSDASPAELLENARASSTEQRTATFTGRLRIEEEDPEGGGTFTTRLSLDGSVRMPDRARYRLAGDGFVSEVITIGRIVYGRGADDRAGLAAEKWAKTDPQADEERAGVVREGGLAAGADEVGDPIGLLEALGAAREPTLVRRTGDTSVVKADIDPARAFGSAVASQIDSATIELTLAKDERIDRAVLSARGEGGNVTADYRFTKWGGPVTVAAPAASDLDPTPLIEEEDIAEFKAAKLFQPRGIPAGWVLDAASVLPKEMTAENCEQVELDYIDPEDPDSGYLSLFQLPKSCAELTPPRGAEPFKAGRYTGYVEEGPDGALAQIVVGDTVVQADTDLPLDGLARILADLIPLDLAATPAELPGFEQTTAA